MPVNRPPGVAVVEGAVQAIAFADSLHGWISVAFGERAAKFSWTVLILTSDGGRTWNESATVPELTNVQMLLVSPSEGWLFGPEVLDGNYLYVTRDGARSWQQVAPTVPGSMYSEVQGLPTFENAKQGFRGGWRPPCG